MNENERPDASPSTDDQEFYDLFASFESVRASDELKDATLARILEGGAGNARPAEHEDARSGKSLRARWRVIRVAALAACLALALSGGVAYALPSARVTVSQGDASVELGVNVFGVTVTASSPDDEGQQIVEQTPLTNVAYDESLSRVYDAFEARDDWAPVDVQVVAGDGGQRQHLEDENAEVAASRPPHDGPVDDSRPEAGPGGDVPPADPGEPPAAGPTGREGGTAPDEGASPDAPSPSDAADKPGAPDESGMQGTPGESDVPEAPDEADELDTPDAPSEPKASRASEVLDESGASESLDESGSSKAFEVQEASGTREASDWSEASDGPRGDSGRVGTEGGQVGADRRTAPSGDVADEADEPAGKSGEPDDKPAEQPVGSSASPPSQPGERS